MSLHNKIINIPCEVDQAKKAINRIEYRKGHFDARHSAAELISNLTPQEFWSLAPWNYDIAKAPTDKSILIKRKNGSVTKATNIDNKWSVRSAIDGLFVEIKQAIAWLPLPENK